MSEHAEQILKRGWISAAKLTNKCDSFTSSPQKMQHCIMHIGCPIDGIRDPTSQGCDAGHFWPLRRDPIRPSCQALKQRIDRVLVLWFQQHAAQQRAVLAIPFQLRQRYFTESARYAPQR